MGVEDYFAEFSDAIQIHEKKMLAVTSPIKPWGICIASTGSLLRLVASDQIGEDAMRLTYVPA